MQTERTVSEKSRLDSQHPVLPRQGSALNSAAHTAMRPAIPPRTAILTSADLSFRQRVRDALTALRWQVREAGGGAEALEHLAAAPAETMIVDTWLPDLEIGEFLAEFERLYDGTDLVALGDLGAKSRTPRSPRRNEVLFALRRGQDGDGAAWNSAPVLERAIPEKLERVPAAAWPALAARKAVTSSAECHPDPSSGSSVPIEDAGGVTAAAHNPSVRLPEFIGDDPLMLEVSRRIRIAAPHSSTVLVQGSTGTGKELVAAAVHRLSARSNRPFVALNCAAIPEALLEAELFGHTRGAFTGAVQGRMGRIEAANGGTLFLDEIGEMPLAFQAKLLRFVESGELQRVGENETVRVDVRVIAATHRPLLRLVKEGSFRADLYYRLSVFLIRMPPLAARMNDLPLLAAHFLDRMGQRSPAKSLHTEALRCLEGHSWPGNVRELEHVLERAWILAEERPEIGAAEIEFGESEIAE
jgi:DNA-binding NtrC family response regulator